MIKQFPKERNVRVAKEQVQSTHQQDKQELLGGLEPTTTRFQDLKIKL